MNCLRCGEELRADMIRPDGTLMCKCCGAIYRRKSTQSSSRFAAEAASRLQSAAQQAGQMARRANEAVSDMHIGEKLDQAARSAGKAAADLNISEKLERVSQAAERKISRLGKKEALSLALVILLIVLAFAGVGIARNHEFSGVQMNISARKESKSVKDLLNRLEKAYNEKDVYGLLKVYDPTYTDGMLGMLSLFGVDDDALESLMPFASQILAQYSSTDIGKVKLTLRELTVNGDNGTVRYEVDMKFKDGGKNSLTDTANIVKVKGKWYFSAC